MADDEAIKTSVLIAAVIADLPYYNERAKRDETAKYAAAELTQLAHDDPDSVLVATMGSQIVGFCISKYDDATIWLSWFGVAPANRSTGMGRRLLEALELTVRRRGAHKIWCDTRTDNVRSQAVIQRFGFRRITEIANHWYGQDFVLWEKLVD
ncbi:MAG: GNAT family N-acetyltransferase [Thermoanaerobaculia bacterium]